MGTHPANLVVRFLLELLALVALGRWGWAQREDGFRVLIGVALPLVAAVIWGTFAVPNDPTRSGSAPIPVPGVVRLALESGFFVSAICALYGLGLGTAAALFTAAVISHYLLSLDRVRWLVEQHVN